MAIAAWTDDLLKDLRYAARQFFEIQSSRRWLLHRWPSALGPIPQYLAFKRSHAQVFACT